MSKYDILKTEFYREHKISPPPRNTILVNAEYAEILINSKALGLVKVKIDKDDIEYCGSIRWLASENARSKLLYIRSSDLKVRLHRALIGCSDPSKHVDHINRDTLDNRKQNLRIVTPKENLANRGGKFEKEVSNAS